MRISEPGVFDLRICRVGIENSTGVYFSNVHGRAGLLGTEVISNWVYFAIIH